MSSFKNFSFFCLLLQLFSKTSAINVALNKMAAYCKDELLLNKMVDGIKTTFEAYTNPCDDFSYVQVELGGKHAVHYVIVFEGEGNNDGQLEFFSVNLVEGSKVELCAEYPGTGNTDDNSRGLRVNCANRHNMYSKVYLYSRKNIGFVIAEIEVHSLAQPGEGTLLHVGCFGNFGSTVIESNLASCTSFCLYWNYVFAGLKNNKMCACSNELNKDEELPKANCDVPCDVTDDRPQNYCGGTDTYSVYLIASVLPYYVGCLNTSADFISNSVGHGDMTVAKCLHLCENQSYALLQTGDHCICLEMIIADDIFQKGCSTACTGDANFFCGDRRQASVYSTCLTEMVNLACSEFFKCEGSYDMYGDCGGVCKLGFLGDHCIEMEFEAKIFSTAETTEPAACLPTNPCSEQPNTVCVLLERKEKCICMKGYVKVEHGEECEDIDECKYEICDNHSSECINLNGSYECLCKDGFVKLSDDICLRNETDDLFEIFDLPYYVFLLIPLIYIMFTIYFWVKAPLKTTESTTISTHTSRFSKWSNW